MGPLLYHERGRVHMAIREPITRWRWARKTFQVPKEMAAASATLWLYLRQTPWNRENLNILLNDQALETLEPDTYPQDNWVWHSVHLLASALRVGKNIVTLHSESLTRSGWSVGVELGHAQPMSAISFDRGCSWNADGIADIGGGEYVVRLRSHAKVPPDPVPQLVYEQSDHPRLREWRDLVPAAIRDISDRAAQLTALRAWVSRCWRHQSQGTVYTPWDAPTILDWTRRQQTVDGVPIAMCVHYGSLFASLCMTLGHTTRCVVTTGAIGEPNGHFMVEVWDPARSAWQLHDPNTDTHYVDPHVLSAVEVHERVLAGQSLHELIRRTADAAPLSPGHQQFYDDQVLTGNTFRHLALWRSNDFVSSPTSAPLAHGSVGYVETDLIWFVAPTAQDMAMFPYRIMDRDFFTAPPHATASAAAAQGDAT
ncbi:MAG: transglutaminase-like domain-containing protein [Pirellulales bacterium]